MTIRTRLTLWYALTLAMSLLLIGGLSYREIVLEPRGNPAEADDDGESTSPARDYEEVSEILLWIALPAALLGLAGGWWLTRKALSPVQALTAAAKRIHEFNLDQQIPRTGNGDELDRLTAVFNEMTMRLDGAFRRERDFTLHASHELKTPLTVLRADMETALREEPLTEAQRERVFGQLEEAQRLARIVDGLALLTKADAGQVPLAAEPLPWDQLVREACEDARVLARPMDLRVDLTGCEPATVRGDRDRLRQLLLNLLDNAVKYNRPGGRILVSLRVADRRAELKISNTGAGLAPEALPRVFDRFYRGETARGQSPEGCGLGLSIAQWIVLAHGGDIRIEPAPGAETVVTVRLPLEGGKTTA